LTKRVVCIELTHEFPQEYKVRCRNGLVFNKEPEVVMANKGIQRIDSEGLLAGFGLRRKHDFSELFAYLNEMEQRATESMFARLRAELAGLKTLIRP
jgi:hypothetical protein